ncbi:unnamed protein product [Urochloa humidicola]
MEAADAKKQIRQSSRIKNQGDGSMKIMDKAELRASKKNLEGLQKPSDKATMEQGGAMMKEVALHFHPREATQDDTGVVLLQ